MRLLLWSPRILLVAAMVGGLSMIALVHTTAYIIWGILFMAISGMGLAGSRRSAGEIVVGVEQHEESLVLTRWDGHQVTAPRRGRSLRKINDKTDAARLALQVQGEKGVLVLLKHDKAAMAMVDDLEKRGVVRGPGQVKSPFSGVPPVPR
jgi:hypothetical protein